MTLDRDAERAEPGAQHLASPLRLALSTAVLAALLGIGYVALYGWGEGDAAATAESSAAGASSGESLRAPAAAPVPVVTALAERTALVMRITATGNAEANRTLEVLAAASGELTELPVREGQRVSEGDLLAAVDDTELRLNVESQREIYVRSMATFTQNLAFLDLEGGDVPDDLGAALEESPRRLLSGSMSIDAFRSLIDDPRFDELFNTITRDEVMAAQDNLMGAWAGYRRAELELERARTVAPFGGQVAALDVVRGQRVSSGTALITLVDADPIRVRVEVLESEAGLVREGRRAEVRFAAFPGEVFTGRIDAISPVVDPEQRTLEVIVALRNPLLRLKPGMFAQITLDTEIFDGRLLVPAAAVLLRDDRPMVFIVEEGRSRWSYITKGLENEAWVEVLDGAAAGDEVIVSGHYSLAHDAAVRVVEAETGDAGAGNER